MAFAAMLAAALQDYSGLVVLFNTTGAAFLFSEETSPS
jgi:hypothetical protein